MDIINGEALTYFNLVMSRWCRLLLSRSFLFRCFLLKSEISDLALLRMGAVGDEKGIATFWCLRVGFSQQSDRADLLLSRLMYHVLNEPAMEIVSRIFTVPFLKISIRLQAVTNLDGSLFEILFQHLGKDVDCSLHHLIL